MSEKFQEAERWQEEGVEFNDEPIDQETGEPLPGDPVTQAERESLNGPYTDEQIISLRKDPLVNPFYSGEETTDVRPENIMEKIKRVFKK